MYRDASNFSRFVADSSGLAALGTIAASLIGLRVPHKMPELVVGLIGGLLGVLLAVILQAVRRKDKFEELLERLYTADHLFLRGILNEYEWQELRSIGLRKFD